MKPKEAMGQDSCNRSIQTAYEERRAASVNQFEAEIDELRGKTITDPFARNIRKADRIKLFPGHLKTCGVTQLLQLNIRDLGGAR